MDTCGTAGCNEACIPAVGLLIRASEVLDNVSIFADNGRGEAYEKSDLSRF